MKPSGSLVMDRPRAQDSLGRATTVAVRRCFQILCSKEYNQHIDHREIPISYTPAVLVRDLMLMKRLRREWMRRRRGGVAS